MVFAVGGVINISSRIVVSSHVTIAGQTAPGQGITVYGNGVSYSGADNTITRYIRYRMGRSGVYIVTIPIRSSFSLDITY